MTCENLPDELDDDKLENNHEGSSYSPKIKLISLGEIVQCRKGKRMF